MHNYKEAICIIDHYPLIIGQYFDYWFYMMLDNKQSYYACNNRIN